jgi:hypothetical protein
MSDFSDYLADRRKWAAAGVKGVYGKASAAVGIILAGAIWFNPQWFAAYVPERVSRALTVLIPFAALGSVFLFRWIVSPFFVYKGVKAQLKGKPTREIARKIIEEVKIGGGSGPFSTMYRDPMIVRMIGASEDFGDEGDVEAVCAELAKGGHEDPFEGFEIYYGQGSFKGKRLEFLRDARFSSFTINDDRDAINFLQMGWAENHGLKEVSADEIFGSEKSVRILMRQSIDRLKRRFLSGE